MGLIDPKAQFWPFVALAFVAALGAATQDTAMDAWRIESAATKARATNGQNCALGSIRPMPISPAPAQLDASQPGGRRRPMRPMIGALIRSTTAPQTNLIE